LNTRQMDKPDHYWLGIDFLRGIGVFCLVIMHSAFYYFSGLWDLDLESPPLIITVIGFLLMFAGLFGMISGLVHGISIFRLHRDRKWPLHKILKKKLVTAIFILGTASIYFIFTGPGLADFSQHRMDNSILVELIHTGLWPGFSVDRVLYIDSLVMIGTNIALVSLIWVGLIFMKKLSPQVLLIISGLVLLVSLLRIPLYAVYLESLSDGKWYFVLLLNAWVNKNNPIFPFLAFGLFGSWLGMRLEQGLSHKPPSILGWILLAAGTGLYLILPDTMLERAIDLKWYSIMIMQLGLFLLLILAAVRVFDLHKPELRKNKVARFFIRFGQAGLTAFFWESVVAAMIWRLLKTVDPAFHLNIPAAIFFGLCLALAWGTILMAWEKIHYKGSIEYLYARAVSSIGGFSSKAGKLNQS